MKAQLPNAKISSKKVRDPKDQQANTTTETNFSGEFSLTKKEITSNFSVLYNS